MVKWWDRFWGAVWFISSWAIAYWTGRWFAINASPSDLGNLRYGLIAFSGLFGLLVGAFVMSLVVIGITSGIEALSTRAGHPFVRPPLEKKFAMVPRSQEPIEDAPAASTSAEGTPAGDTPTEGTPTEGTTTALLTPAEGD